MTGPATAQPFNEGAAEYDSWFEKGPLFAIDFHVDEAWSTLRQPPDGQLRFEPPREGAEEDAGFCVLMASRPGAPQ